MGWELWLCLILTCLPHVRMLHLMTDAAPPAPNEPQRWRLTLWSMVAVQFIMSISFSIVGPIMPLYLPELGVVSPASVNLWAGVLASSTSCVAIFTSPLWGGLADRYGRKLMVLRSTLGIAVFTFLMGIAQGPWQMLGRGRPWERWRGSARPPWSWSPPRSPSGRWAIPWVG
jgi:nitrate/nitrite transporter NarK